MTPMERNAARYLWLRENWDAVSGLTWRSPGPELDKLIDAAMAGSAAAEQAFSGVEP